MRFFIPAFEGLAGLKTLLLIMLLQVYFGLSTIMFAVYLKEEQEFLLGERGDPIGESILEKGDVTVGKKLELAVSP